MKRLCAKADKIKITDDETLFYSLNVDERKVLDIVSDYLSKVRETALEAICKTYGNAMVESMKKELVITVSISSTLQICLAYI